MVKYYDDRGKLDYSPLSKREETGFCVPKRLKKRWKLILGDSKVELPKILEKVGNIDFFYHDSEHKYKFMMWEYETVFPYLNKLSIISSDDISWNSAFRDFCLARHLTPILVKSKFGYAIVNHNNAV